MKQENASLTSYNIYLGMAHIYIYYYADSKQFGDYIFFMGWQTSVLFKSGGIKNFF